MVLKSDTLTRKDVTISALTDTVKRFNKMIFGQFNSVQKRDDMKNTVEDFIIRSGEWPFIIKVLSYSYTSLFRIFFPNSNQNQTLG